MTSPIIRPYAMATAPSIIGPGGSPLELEPDDGTAALDTSAAPYASAVIYVPLLDLDLLETLDPRDAVRITLEAGDNSSGAARTFDLGLRERVVDHKARTVMLRLAGDETLLMDYAPLVADTGARAHEASLRAVCDYVLGKIGAALAPGAHDADVTASWALTNYCTNPRAESLTGFTVGANVSAWGVDTTSGSLVGSNYVYWYSTGAGESYLYAPAETTTRAGDKWTATAAFRADAPGRTCRLILHYLDATGALIGEDVGDNVAVPAAPGWAIATVQGTARPGAVKVRLITLHNATAGAQAVGLDAIQLVTGHEIVPHFSGASIDADYDYEWQGAIDASASTRTPLIERPPALFVWPPGVSAWDFLEPLTAAAGFRLFCDESRVWRLIDPATYTAPGVLALHPGSSAEGEDTIALGDPDVYATGVVVRYRWEDEGVQMERTDAAGAAGLVRVIDMSRPYPGPGLAAAVLSRMTGRGRVQKVTALANWTATPAMSATITLPGTLDQAGQVRSIEWGLTDGFMSVTTAALIDIIPGSIDALTGTIDGLTGTIDGL